MRAGYGRFGALSRVEPERFFYLDDEDRKLIAGRRRDYNRLGFALQVVTVRQLGMFLADPLFRSPATWAGPRSGPLAPTLSPTSSSGTPPPATSGGPNSRIDNAPTTWHK